MLSQGMTWRAQDLSRGIGVLLVPKTTLNWLLWLAILSKLVSFFVLISIINRGVL